MARPPLPTGIIPSSIKAVMEWLHGQWDDVADKMAFTDGAGDLVLKDAAGARTTLDVHSKPEANAAYVREVIVPPPSGDTATDTAAAQLAIEEAEAVPGSLLRFQASATSYNLRRLDIKVGDITINWSGARIVHHYDSVIEGTGGAGTTKAYPVFMVYRGAHDVKFVAGYTTSAPSIATVLASLDPGWSSYLAPICVHNADRASVTGGRFDGVWPRAIFQHGGDDLDVHGNDIDDSGVIVHVGYKNNPNFYDDGAVDQTEWYSPHRPSIERNKFRNYTHANSVVIFLSGATDYTVKNNPIIDANAPTSVGVRIYTNDLGMTDADGTPALIMRGEVAHNPITGTLREAFLFLGYSPSATGQVHELRVDVHHNHLDVVGDGMVFERASRIKVHDNEGTCTGAAWKFSRELDDAEFARNTLESTNGDSADNAVVWFNTNISTSRAKMNRNTIICGTGTKRAVTKAAGGTFHDFDGSGNTYVFNGTTASPTVINILGASGELDFSGSKFEIDSAAMADRFLYVITGTANVVLDRNTTLSSSVVLRPSSITATSIQMLGGDGPGIEATVTAQVRMEDWRAVSAYTGATALVKVTDSTYLTITNCWLERSVAVNTPVVQAVSCNFSKLLASRLIGNSNAALLRADTDGAMTLWGLDQTNNGTGGTGSVTSGSATVGPMS